MAGCTCVCAPSLSAEMDDWISLGGSNSGCCGDMNHTSGFHLPGCRVPTSDYSRDREVPPPFNLSWACAADFSHRGLPALRARHAALLARLMADDPSLHMVCEFIGQPWADQPVKYWARWNGVRYLKNYTGVGHDHWSHISLWRSKANLRPYLWVPKAVEAEDDMKIYFVRLRGGDGTVWRSNLLVRTRIATMAALTAAQGAVRRAGVGDER